MRIFLAYLVIDSPQDTGYNYGLGYIAAVLKKGGHAVDYITLKNREDILAFHGKAAEKKPALIGFSATTSQFHYLEDIVKKAKETSGAFIVCGGVHATLEPGCLSETQGLDAIIRGEGEAPMLELADALQNNTDHRCIKNLWLKEGDGILKNDMRPLIKNLDELPFPDKESLDYQRVIDDARGLNRFIFSRGCTFECSYCSNKALSDLYKGRGPYFRSESPERAIEEISSDEKRFKFSEICFDDDTISLNRKWFCEFFNLYRKNFKYPFLCNIRPAAIDEEMIRLLKESGIKKAIVGVEHGNEAFRKTVLKRNMTNAQIAETFKLFKRHGIDYVGQIMVGFPFESKRLFLDTVRLCRELDIQPSNNLSVFYPYPGTELGEICRKNNWLPDKKYYRERSEALISYPTFNRAQIRLCTRVFPILLRHKNISLKIPMGLVRYSYKIFSKIKKF